MSDSEKKKPRVNLRFLYCVCNDVQEIRDFYEGMLGMEVQSFINDDKWGWLCLQSEGFQMMFFRVDKPFEPETGFASQPGWPGGELDVTSWGIAIPEEDFRATYEKIRDSKTIKMFAETPQWYQDSYWGLPVIDPAGNTVEVFTYVKEPPADTVWK